MEIIMIKMIAMDFDWTIVDHSKQEQSEKVGARVHRRDEPLYQKRRSCRDCLGARLVEF